MKTFGFFMLMTSAFLGASAQTNQWNPNPTGDGVSWSDPNNWSLNHIPTALEDVIISETNPAQDSVVIELMTATAKSITLSNQNKLLIRASGSLNMITLTSRVIEVVSGTLTNRGAIAIDTTSYAGIFLHNGASFVNTGTGTVHLNYSEKVGLFVSSGSRFLNNLSATFVSATQQWVSGYLENRGIMELEYIDLYDSLVNSGEIAFIKDPAPFGFIHFRGADCVLLNNGVISSEIQTAPNSLVFHSGYFENQEEGVVDLYAPPLFYNSDSLDFINKNMIRFSGGKNLLDLRNLRLNFDNRDSILLNCTLSSIPAGYSYPVIFAQNITLKGYIGVDIPAPLNEFAIWAFDVVNEGTLEAFLHHGNRFIDAENLKNYGQLIAHDMGANTAEFQPFSLGGFEMTGKNYNHAGASITLDSSNVPVTNYSALHVIDTLYNYGNLTLKGTALGIRNTDFLYNAGTIHILDYCMFGLRSVGSGYGLNDSTGYILVHNKKFNDAGYLIDIQQNSKFRNKGRVVATHSSGRIISFTSSDSLINSGTITIDTSCIGNSFFTTGKFLNEACGNIFLGNSLTTSTTALASAKNYGILQFDFPAIYNSTVHLDNYGIINIRRGNVSLTGISEGLITYPLRFPISPGVKDRLGFIWGANPPTTDNKLYYNSLKTQQAGTFNEDTFTGTSTKTGNFTLYMAKAPLTGCIDNKVILSVSDKCQCNGTQSNTFTGNGNDWFDASSWSLGNFPGYCDNVSIPSGKNVTIPAGFRARANRLEVANGSVFQTSEGVVADLINCN